MTTFEVGRTYRYLYSRSEVDVVCEARWFGGVCGTLEMVRLLSTDGVLSERCASVFAGGALRPRITETLGGVYRPDMCPHWENLGRVTANAGPNAGRLCCAACGGAVDGQPDPWPYVREEDPLSHVPLCTHLKEGVEP